MQKANCDTEYGYLYETKLIHQVPAEVRTGIFITCHAPEGVNYTVFVLVLASEFWDLLGISDSREWNLWLQEEAEPFFGGGDFVNLCQDNLSFLTSSNLGKEISSGVESKFIIIANYRQSGLPVCSGHTCPIDSHFLTKQAAHSPLFIL